MEALVKSNSEKLAPYGTDNYTASAKEKIRAACQAPNADVFLLVGGTQTNKTVIDSLLHITEGVISATTGHVNCHESGAIERTGHKVMSLPHVNGKLEAATVEAYLKTFYGDESHEHMVYPGMVYISHPTEYGTLYTKAELEALSAVCRAYKIPLFLDGARLGYGLAAENDLTLPDIARLCDVFYIGGTKVGALCGEAVVFPQGNAPSRMVGIIKQNGALLAKGRLVGVQFDALFTDDTYLRISRQAISTAARLKDIFRAKGYRFFIESPTNQIFVVLENTRMAKIRQHVKISFWEAQDENHTVVRFATSWATEDADIDALEKIL